MRRFEAVSGRGRWRSPCRRAVDRASIGQGDFVWQLATARHILRYIPVQGRKLLQLVASPAMRIVNGDRLLQFIANGRDWPCKVRVAAHQCKGVHIVVKHRIEDHFSCDVDIRPLFFKSDDGCHAVRLVAGNAWLLVERHLDLVLCVEALYDLYTRQGGKHLKVVVLPKELIGIMGECFNPCGEVFDCDNFDVAGDDCVGELFEVKPLVWSTFQHSVVQVEPVYVEIYFHGAHRNAKAGLPRPCAALAVPWRVDMNLLRGSARIVSNRIFRNKWGNSFSEISRFGGISYGVHIFARMSGMPQPLLANSVRTPT